MPPASLTSATAFLARLVDGPAGPLRARIVVVTAHPDDETIGCGALLPRLPDLRLVLVTDGAPQDGADAAHHGFANAQDYAAGRRRELLAALALAGQPETCLVALGIPDQQAARDLAGLARDLLPLIRGAAIVLTHAYEGGHPDHDATAYAVHAAARLLAGEGAAPAIIEMPFYHAGPDGAWAVQSFLAEPALPETVLQLDEPARALKRAMMAAHQSQARTLSLFSTEAERYRAAPAYDFTRLPNGGALLYERQGWGGLTGALWQERVREADLALAREAGP